MTTCLGKSCSFGLPCMPFVNCCQFMYLVISLLVLRAGYGIWLYQFLIIAYLFTFQLWTLDQPTVLLLLYWSRMENVSSVKWWHLPFLLLEQNVSRYFWANMVDTGVGTLSVSHCRWWGKVAAQARAGDAASSSYLASGQPWKTSRTSEVTSIGTSIYKMVLVWFLFYGPSTHFRSFWARSVNLATLFLGKQFTST